MAYDEGLATRIRDILIDQYGITERKMFGGLCFMVGGNMCCGIVGDKLMARVGPQAYEDCLSLPCVEKMDFTGRPMKGMIYVTDQGLQSDQALENWINQCLAFAGSLPVKKPAKEVKKQRSSKA